MVCLSFYLKFYLISKQVESNDLSNNIPIQETVDSIPQNEGLNLDKVITSESKANDQQNIEVVLTDSNNGIILDQLNNSENKNESELSPNMSPFSSAKFKHKVKVRVTTSSHNESETETGSSPPPPPPPPMRPQMTTFTSAEPITLPNGQVLPSGTKQIVVHPYQSSDPFKYTPEWYYNAFNAQNSTTPSNNASETQGVVKAN